MFGVSTNGIISYVAVVGSAGSGQGFHGDTSLLELAHGDVPVCIRTISPALT